MGTVRRLAWSALIVNVAVILVGALVRATGSGAGCGRSWPTCHGELLPAELGGEKLVEFSHRAVSGVALLLVFVLFVVVIRRHGRPLSRAAGALRGAPLERAVGWSLVAVVGEALIGAGLVLFEWVAHDRSVARTVAVPLHLVNTLLLLAALAVTVWLSSGRSLPPSTADQRRRIAFGLGAMVLVAAAGAVTALADTLFPAESLAEGLVDDFSSAAEWLTRMRIVHPFLAVLSALLLVWLVSARELPEPVRTGRWARAVVWLVVAQVIAGAVNVVLLTPVWMQLIHLLLADLLWIAFIWFALDLVAGPDQSSASSAGPSVTGATQTIRSQT